MERYERILICIDCPGRDSGMLAYCRAIARLARSRQVYLLHVVDDEGLAPGAPPEGPSALPDAGSETLQGFVAKHFAETEAPECLCEVIHGAPLIETLRFGYENDVDLIVIGRHYGEAGEADDEAVMARRITRKATCSVLVVPEDLTKVEAATILVPVRDSECSAHALDVACGIANATDAVVVALNVYQVHTGYSRVGTTLAEHQSLLALAAQRECERLTKRVDTQSAAVQCRAVPDLHGKPVPVILGEITNGSADLVVIGARGRTGAAGVLLGNVTERLIRESPVPVLAVKKKGECLGVLRALLTLAAEE